MRVAYLLSGREGGGITSVVSSLIQNLDPRVVEPSLLLLSQSSILKRATAQGYRYRLIKKRFRGDLTVVFRIIAYCLKNRIDILHTHSISGNFYGRLAGIWMPSTTVISTVHATTLDELRGVFRRKMLAWCVYRFDLWMHRFSARIITVSESLREELISHGVPERKIHTVRHGICLDDVNTTEEEREEVQRTLNINGSKKKVGIVGRLTRAKNHELFIRAGKQVAGKHPALELLIVGDGPLRNRLESLVADLSMSEMTVFTGWVNRIYPVLHVLDVLVVSSSSEGFGYILLEGMACGKAIVATHISEIPHIIKDGETGILVPPHDVSALADAIDQLLRNSQKRNEMGERAREDVARRFPLDREVKSTVDIYLNTLGLNLQKRQSRR